MIEIKEKQKCCGCWACENVCPKQCITMEMDDEGFRYPVVDKDKCVDCHLCEKACPELKPKQNDDMPLANFIIQQKDKEILRRSTSGGFFTAISEYVIRHGGVVFGAAFGKDMVLRHTYAETLEDCAKFRGSKYLQSEIGHAYSDAKRFLKQGRMVVFSGTPCQIAGLYGAIGGCICKYLITVDLVCRGVPSPLVFKKYLGTQNAKRKDEAIDYRSRDKFYGYLFSTASIFYKNQQHDYHQGKESDLMLRLYFKDLISRPSCYDCHFKTLHRVSDITIFDCWDAPATSSEFSADGATNVFIHTEKGRAVFEEIKDKFTYAHEDIDKIIKRDGIMIQHHVVANPRRAAFFKDLQVMQVDEIERKYAYIKPIKKIANTVKPWLFKIGVFGVYLKLKRNLSK